MVSDKGSSLHCTYFQKELGECMLSNLRSFLCETYSVQKELHRAYIRALCKAHIKKPYVKTYGKKIPISSINEHCLSS